MKRFGPTLLAGAFALLSMTASAQTPGCSADEHRQFDFWVGHWDVFGPAETRRPGCAAPGLPAVQASRPHQAHYFG